MTIEYSDAITNIREIDNILKKSGPDRVTNEQVTDYFESFRVFFKHSANDMIQAVSSDDQEAIFRNVCNLNALFGIGLKHGVTLPKDLYEIAYDFDNPDYPGFDTALNKVASRQYLALQ